MIVRKPSNDICGTCYKFHMRQKGGGMCCRGVEGKEEKEEDDSGLDLDYEDDCDYNMTGIEKSYCRTKKMKRKRNQKILMDTL